MINAANQAGSAMRAVILVAIVSLIACAFVPRYAAQMMSTPNAATSAASAVVVARHDTAAAPRSVVIAPSRGGHFRVTGRVDGRRIDFMVDTGASVIALKPEDAASLGIRPAERDYSAMVRTANGAIRVAPVALDTVEIEDLEVHNVAAVVLPAGVANENLLGLSFLRRLRRFEYADGKLVLEQ
jgi:aspartyl protease family protein